MTTSSLGNLSAFARGRSRCITEERINDDQWHHIGVTLTIPNIVRVYLDGNLVKTCTEDPGGPLIHFFAGAGSFYGEPSFFVEGKIDDLRIYDRVRPAFTLVDAIDIMENKGPRNGAKRHFGIIFSGVNCLSIDVVMAKCLGIGIQEAPLLQTAVKHGYTGTSVEEIEVKGETMEATKINDFTYPESLTDISFSLKGVIQSVCLHLWLLFVGEKRRQLGRHDIK